MPVIHSKHDIFTLVQRHHEQIKNLGVTRLGLFGSFVRGRAKPDSDIDFLVEFAPGKKTFDSFMQLSFLLEEVLGRQVELVTMASLSPYLGPHILKEVEYIAIAA